MQISFLQRSADVSLRKAATALDVPTCEVVRFYPFGSPSIDALGAKPAYKHRLKAGLLDISAVNTS